MTIKEIAGYVCEQLAGKVIIHRYEAYSTNSIYLKFDYGVANSLRISDHPGKKHLNYRYNIETDMSEFSVKNGGDGYAKYYYPVEYVDFAIKDILEGKKARMSNYKDYDRAVEVAKMRIQHEKGFWQQAKEVKPNEE